MDGDGLHAIIKWVKLLSEKGKTVVIITHDLLLAKAASDKFLYLEEGKQIKEREKVLYEYNQAIYKKTIILILIFRLVCYKCGKINIWNDTFLLSQ